jgi:hypothetical protein
MSTTTEVLFELSVPTHELPAIVAESVYCHEPSGTKLSVHVKVPDGGVQVKVLLGVLDPVAYRLIT